ncbi:SAM-dependent methyltransferase [bacterium]|nr:SAM-dependent methyltransferase [bacterium]
MKKVNRKNKISIIDALNEAQKLAFAPLAFQALASMLDLGIVDFLDKKPSDKKEIIKSLNLDEYTVNTLLEIGSLNNIVTQKDNIFELTKMGKMFLYDDMTKVNFNYVRNVCYLGASEMTNCFKSHKPKGLTKFVGDYPTIYPALTVLPKEMKKSWYEFDHYYSDNCFEEIFSIITEKYSSVIDIGGNTGKFEKLCLSHDRNFDITMLDLKVNIDKIKDDPELENCKFSPINVLDKVPEYPKMKDCAVLMSQFLDCFSKKDIIKILTDIKNNKNRKSSIYILEPYTDLQKSEGAKYALSHTSLYFTCMANGVSKMYTFEEMKELIEKAGINIINRFDDIGSYSYTLLECV